MIRRSRKTARRARVRPVVAALAATSAIVAAGAVSMPASALAPSIQPTWRSPSAPIQFSSPAVLTVGGQTLVLTSDSQGYLTARNGSGTVVWQKWIDPMPGQRSCSNSSPSVGDITGDGVPEIVVGAGCHDQAFKNQQGGVVAFDAKGNTLWRFRTADAYNVWTGGLPDGYSDGVFGAPSLGDLDGDGVSEVVFGSFDHFVYALDGRGAKLGSYDNWDTIFSTPALVDVDNDPGLEILIGGDATENKAILGGTWTGGGTLRSLDLTTTGLQQRWLMKYDDIVGGSIATGDVNGDGTLDAVFATGGFYNRIAGKVWAVNAKTGATLPGFPKVVNGNLKTSVAVGQLRAGGNPEIAVSDMTGAVLAFDGRGNKLWQSQLRADPNYGVEGGGVTIADVVGDGGQEVIVPVGTGGLSFFRADNGQVLNDWVGDRAVQNAPAIVDFGSQGGRQIVMAGHNGNMQSGEVTGVRIKGAVVADEWPTFARNAERTSAARSTRIGENVNLTRALYVDMLGRPATDGDARHWAKVMTTVGDRAIATGPGFRTSLEYRKLKVHMTYEQTLGRPEESAADLNYWAAKIDKGDLTIDQLPGVFMVTEEFYKLGGGTDEGLVKMMIQRSMERPATQADLNKWVPVVKRSQVEASMGIYNDPESVLLRVNRTYEAWMGRPAGASERTHWSNWTLANGDDGMRFAVMNSQEYVNRAQVRSYPTS